MLRSVEDSEGQSECSPYLSIDAYQLFEFESSRTRHTWSNHYLMLFRPNAKEGQIVLFSSRVLETKIKSYKCMSHTWGSRSRITLLAFAASWVIRAACWTVFSWSRVVRIGMPSMLTTTMPSTPLWDVRRLIVSSTSDCVFNYVRFSEWEKKWMGKGYLPLLNKLL